MKVNIIDGNHKKARKRIDEILDIYNDEKRLDEGFTNDYPDKAAIAYIKGVKGGVIAETVFKGGYLIYYAAFEEGERGKGYLTKCLREIEKQKGDIYGVQLNPFDDFEFWQRRGFKNQILFNFVITYINIDVDEFNRLMDKRPNNDNF